MPQGDIATTQGRLRRSLGIALAITAVLAVATLLAPVPYAVVIAVAALLLLTVATLLVVMFLDALNLPFGVAPALVVLLGVVATLWLAAAHLRARAPETAKGTKLSAIRPISGSSRSNSVAPMPTSSAISSRRMMPALITIRMPSMSSMPRVINSPV